MTTNETIAEARRLYAPKIRRAEVITLCALFGHSQYVARSLIDGPTAAVKGKVYGAATRRVNGEIVTSGRRRLYDRDEVITACL